MRLSQYVNEMLASEGELDETLDRLSPDLKEHPGAADLVKRLHATTKRHREDLQHRIDAIRVEEEEKAYATRGREPADRALETLRALHGQLSQAALGYAILHAVAHRYFDGPQEGTTAELAENHLKDYAEVFRLINNVISDIAIWELGRQGQECQCECPSCGLGICLCSPHGMNTVADVWRESANIPAASGINGMRVRLPRHGSPAAIAEVRSGDSIVAVDGQEVKDESWDSIMTMQQRIRGHKPGEVVRLRIRRESGSTDEIHVLR